MGLAPTHRLIAMASTNKITTRVTMNRTHLKTALKLIFSMALLLGMAAAQTTVVWTDRALAINPFSANGVSVPAATFAQYAWVRVCSVPATGTPCTPVAAITDISGNPLSISGGNFGQLQTDIVGKWTIGCSPGTYQIQVEQISSNTPFLTYYFTCPSGGTALLTTTNAWSGVNTFKNLNGIRNAALFIDGTNTDIGLAEVAACADLPATGGTIYIPAGQWTYANTITNCGKDVVIQCAGEGSNQLAGYGTLLDWNGVGGNAVSLTGGNVQTTIRDCGINNSGSGAVGIDIDGVNTSFTEHVTIFPAVGFSAAGIRIGNTLNTVAATLSKTYVRGNVGPGLQATNIAAHLTLDDTRIIYNGVANTTPNILLGDATHSVNSFHMDNGSTAESQLDVDDVLIVRCETCVFDNMYFEYGQSAVAPTHGYAVNCDSTSLVCKSITISNSYLSAAKDSVHTTWAFNSNLGSADWNVENNEFKFMANPAHVFRNQNRYRIWTKGNTLNSTNLDIAAVTTWLASVGNSPSTGTPTSTVNDPWTFNQPTALAGGATVGGGSTILKYYVVSGAITPGVVNANTCAEQTFSPAAFAGVVNAGDNISLVGSGTMAGNGVYPVEGIRAIADGVGITYCNSTAGNLTPPAVTITVKGTR